ncbi:hypothetical protein HHK36_010527 [Tetracentron sinense]|uniref:Amino acid transporter transmembrane domain-containing protein n=1 Tax=Tetracentron sinense TaxID=13715 RepID=A0A834ZED5_TETSI|nr:hypothetical protein HHK36_010527 [Tetracentron sinense]
MSKELKGGTAVPLLEPPASRRATGAASSAQTLGNIIVSIVGTGVLGLPFAFRIAGWLAGSLGVIVAALSTYYCMLLLIHCRDMLASTGSTDIQTYGDLGFKAFGRAGRYLTEFLVVISQCGGSVAYLVFIGQNLSSIFRTHTHTLTFSSFVFLLVPVEIALSWIRSLSAFAPFSIFADICNALAMAIVVKEDLQLFDGFSKAKAITSVGALPFAGGVAVFCFEGFGMTLALEASMRDKRRFRCVLAQAFTGVTLVYVMFGLFGYLAYGDHTKDIVTLNLPNDWSATAVKGQYQLCLLTRKKKSEGLQFAQEDCRHGEGFGARAVNQLGDRTSLPGREIGGYTRMESGEGSRSLKKNQKRNLRRRRLRRERKLQSEGSLPEDTGDFPNRAKVSPGDFGREGLYSIGLVEGAGPLALAGGAQNVSSGRILLATGASEGPEPPNGVGGALLDKEAQEFNRASSGLLLKESGCKLNPVAAVYEAQRDQVVSDQGEDDQSFGDLRNLSRGEGRSVSEGELVFSRQLSLQVEVDLDFETLDHGLIKAREEGEGRVVPVEGDAGQLGDVHRVKFQEPFRGGFWVEGSGGSELEQYTPLVFGELEVEQSVRGLNTEVPVSVIVGHEDSRIVEGRQTAISEAPSGLSRERQVEGTQFLGKSRISVLREEQGGDSQWPGLNSHCQGQQKPLLPNMSQGEVSGWVVANVEAVGDELGVSTDGRDTEVRSLYWRIEGNQEKDRGCPQERQKGRKRGTSALETRRMAADQGERFRGLRPYRNRAEIGAARIKKTALLIGLCVGLAFTFPIMMHPIHEIVEGKLKDSGWLQKFCYNNSGGGGGAVEKFGMYASRALLVVALAVLASCVPGFGMFVSLVGSTVCALLSFVLPSMFHLVLMGSYLRLWQRALDFCILTFGLVFAAYGTYSTIVGVSRGSS